MTASVARKTMASSRAPGRVAREPEASLRILGIDPGTLRMGYGVVERVGPGRVAYVECGVIAAPASRDRLERLGLIGQSLRELIDELRPHAVALEEAFYGKNVQSTLALGEARGVSIFVAAQAGLSVTGYAPAKVKNTIVGSGRATKTQVSYLVRALLGLRRDPEPDAADALAIALCHARSVDFATKVPGPARTRAASRSGAMKGTTGKRERS
ncbi:MAG: crossover junction endodeoxyribonuclease RuvC [Myxococcales bacterium]|nr:crossover junction endodeoxyribonuclease RuvC [Myxococcales bacterium]